MIVREGLNFERGMDPKDALKIGNEKLRAIQKDYEYLGPIVKNLQAPDDEFTFQKVRQKIDGLKSAIEIIIIEHIRKKYNIKFEEDQEEFRPGSPRLFASAEIGEYRYELRRNGVGSTYWAKVINLKGRTINRVKSSSFSGPSRMIEQDFFETSQSTSLRIFDEKFQKLLKKFS